MPPRPISPLERIPAPTTSRYELTEQQRSAMVMRKQGMTYKQIGRRLGISYDMAAYAARHGTARWYRLPKYPQTEVAELNRLLDGIPIEELEAAVE